MFKKEMIAMLLAGGQGSRLGVLTAKVAKPAVAFGGKYRIIDFPLSNCINSGIDTEVYRYFLLMRRVLTVNGTPVRQTRFIRILIIWRRIIRIMFLFFQATIFTKWITK